MKEQQERKAGAAIAEARGEWIRPKVNILMAGAAEGAPVLTTDFNIPS